MKSTKDLQVLILTILLNLRKRILVIHLGENLAFLSAIRKVRVQNKTKKTSRNIKGEIAYSNPHQIPALEFAEEHKFISSDGVQNLTNRRVILLSDQMSNKSSRKSQKYQDSFTDFINKKAPSLSNSIDYSSLNTPSESVNRTIRSQAATRENIRHNTLMLAPIIEESKVISH